MFNFKFWSSKVGSAALPAAAASVGSKKESTAELRVAATAYSGTPGALAASAVGDTAIVSLSNGSLAGAATDLLDALNSDCIKEFSGQATIVLGDNGGCAAVETDLHGTYNSRGVFSSIAIGCILHAEDHGGAASVQGDTGSAASSLFFDLLIRDSESNSSHHPIHACAHSGLDLCGVGSGVGVGLGACAGASCGVFSWCCG